MTLRLLFTCLLSASLLAACNRHESDDPCVFRDCEGPDQDFFDACVANGLYDELDDEEICRAGNRRCCALEARCLGDIGDQVVVAASGTCMGLCEEGCPPGHYCAVPLGSSPEPGADTCAPCAPDADDVCDGLDSDCDDAVDEDCACSSDDDCFLPSAPTCVEGTCTAGCSSGSDVCDGVDSDCDLAIDEDCVCSDSLDCFDPSHPDCIDGSCIDCELTPGACGGGSCFPCSLLPNLPETWNRCLFFADAAGCAPGDVMCCADAVGCVGEIPGLVTIPQGPECCASDDECPSAHVCSEEAGWICVPSDCAGSCPDGRECVGGTCECFDDDVTAERCEAGEFCAFGYCEDVSPCADVTCESGTGCFDGECVPLCVDMPSACESLMSCDAGHCVSPPTCVDDLDCLGSSYCDTEVGYCFGCSSGPDVCNGFDEDCDGLTDEDCFEDCTVPGDEDGNTVADCDDPACAECCGRTAESFCDGVDDDCDFRVDEDFRFMSEVSIGEACGDDFGECTAGTVVCAADGMSAECSGIGPATETCDGLDNDCDGNADEDFDLGSSCGTDIGECRMGMVSCDGLGGVECAGEIPPSPESCDGLDNDCDGLSDDADFDAGESCIPIGDYCTTSTYWYCDTMTGAPACVETSGEGPRCDDFNECTADSCDEGTRSCSSVGLPLDTPCFGEGLCSGPPENRCIFPG